MQEIRFTPAQKSISNLYHFLSDGEFHHVSVLNSLLGVTNVGDVARRLKPHIEPHGLTIQAVRLPRKKTKSLIMVKKGEML